MSFFVFSVNVHLMFISFVHNHVGSQYTLIHHSQVSYSCVHVPRAKRITLTLLQCCSLVCRKERVALTLLVVLLFARHWLPFSQY